MKAFLKRFVADENGLELVEYAVMTALIVAGLVTVVTLLGDAVSSKFSDVTGEINNAGAGGGGAGGG